MPKQRYLKHGNLMTSLSHYDLMRGTPYKKHVIIAMGLIGLTLCGSFFAGGYYVRTRNVDMNHHDWKEWAREKERKWRRSALHNSLSVQGIEPFDVESPSDISPAPRGTLDIERVKRF